MTRSALALAVAGLCSGIAPAQDKFPQFEKRVYEDGDKKLPYRLLVPGAYQPGTPCPLAVWLHGSGEKGTDNVAPLRAAFDRTFLADRETCPAFVLVPQCPTGKAWHAVGLNKPAEITEPSRLVVRAIAAVHKEFGLDGRRIYLGGFSMGGCGTWDLLTRYPDLFAAAFPLSGPPGDREALAPVVKHIPTWIVHGEKDRVAPVEMSRTIAAALKAAGADVTYTEYPGMGHECAKPLADPKLRAWLWSKTRATDPSFTEVPVPPSAALMIKTLPDGTKGEWAGKVERGEHGVPRLPIDAVRYRLKASATAAAGVVDLLTKIGKGQLTGEFTVTGTVALTDLPWVVVDRIEAKK